MNQSEASYKTRGRTAGWFTPTVMPVKCLPANLTEPQQMYPVPRAGKQLCCETTGGCLANQWWGRRVFVFFFKASILRLFWVLIFFLKTGRLPKEKCLCSPTIILGRCTANYQIKRWVSEGTHTGEKQREARHKHVLCWLSNVKVHSSHVHKPGGLVHRRRVHMHLQRGL